MKTALLAVFLLAFLVLHPRITAAQAPAGIAVCEYNKNNVQNNPKTKQPYTQDERNQQPFDGGSITKDEIKLCLDANMKILDGFRITEQSLESLKSDWNGPINYLYELQGIKGQAVWGKEKFLTLIEKMLKAYKFGVYAPEKSFFLKHARIRIPIKNHHILFEEYHKAWKELADETKNYAIPLLLEGGVLHDKVRVIHLEKFSDPNAKDDFNPDELKTFGLEKENLLIPLIRAEISWKEVSIDSAVIRSREYLQIKFSKKADLSGSIFSEEVDFNGSNFSAGADFSRSEFSKKADFGGSEFRGKANFSVSKFSDTADFTGAKFSDTADFTGAKFSEYANFRRSKFSDTADFTGSKFIGIADFIVSKFSDTADFTGAKFSKGAFFSGASFIKIANFTESIFGDIANFSIHEQFEELTTFGGKAIFIGSTFSGESNFSESIFIGEADFTMAIKPFGYKKPTTFSREANFNRSNFSNTVNFHGTRFKENADFRNMFVKDRLTFSDTTWEKRLDLRSMSVKELHWDSTKNPSDVKGVADFREASIGSSMFKEVRFQDLTDFSRTTFGKYKGKDKDKDGKNTIVKHPSPRVLFENNTFEKEADFLHVNFSGSSLLINNRFRSTLDLTGAEFGNKNGHLCLSFNRINRLVFEPKHLGNLPGFNPLRQIPTLFNSLLQRWKPLEESKIRRVVQTKCIPVSQNSKPEEKSESLSNLYKTLGESFRVANDQGGINATFYLQQVAEPPLGKLLSWLFLDLPSRYAVDVWCTVWVSILIMVCFYVPYVELLRRIARSDYSESFKITGQSLEKLKSEVPDDVLEKLKEIKGQEVRGKEKFLAFLKDTLGEEQSVQYESLILKYADNSDYNKLHVPRHEDRKRAFRLRLFEPMNRKDVQDTRTIIPWRDAATLSFRAFTKIGLGASYPNTMGLKVLMGIEWILGVYMLIHFSLAVKNNLSFIVPFLGMVN